jgi:hypothetical protein
MFIGTGPANEVEMATLTLDDSSKTNKTVPSIATETSYGRKSKIHAYCNDPQQENEFCIWFCRRYGRDTLAFDVNMEDVEKGSGRGSFQLRRFDRWWTRFGFYTIVGVRHVQVCSVRSVPSKYSQLIRLADPVPGFPEGQVRIPGGCQARPTRPDRGRCSRISGPA